MTDSKDIILQQIANTIIANLGNTTGIGLMEGKAGLCLFFYEYARYTGMEYYEDLANQLLEYEMKHFVHEIERDTDKYVSELGVCLSILINKSYVSDKDGYLLNKIDNYFIEKKGTFDVNVGCWPVIYMLNRLVNTGVYPNVLNHITRLLSMFDEPLKENVYLANNIYYLFHEIYKHLPMGAQMKMPHSFLKEWNVKYHQQYSYGDDSENIKWEALVKRHQYGLCNCLLWENFCVENFRNVKNTVSIEHLSLDDCMHNCFYEVKNISNYLAITGLFIIKEYGK